jgi:hypothetical protein
MTPEERQQQAAESLDVLLHNVANRLVFIAARPLPDIRSNDAGRFDRMPLTNLSELRVRNLDGFNVLLAIFVKLWQADHLQVAGLNRILVMFSSHQDNYWLLIDLHPLSLFIELLPVLKEDVQVKVLSILRYIVEVQNCVPFQELAAIAVLLRAPRAEPEAAVEAKQLPFATPAARTATGKEDIPQIARVLRTDYPESLSYPTNETRMRLLEVVIDLINIDAAYKDTFRDAGLLEVLREHLALLCDYVNDKNTTNQTPEPPLNSVEVFDMALFALHSMLDHNHTNLKLFRQREGATSLYGLISSDAHRISTLKWLAGRTDSRNLSNLMETLQITAGAGEPRLQYDMLCCLNSMLHDPSGTVKELWRSVSGIECVFSILTSMASAIDNDLEHRDHWLKVLQIVFCVIKTSINEHPLNRAYFKNAGGWSFLYDTVSLTNVMTDAKCSHIVLQSLMDICTETMRDWELEANKQFKYADVHMSKQRKQKLAQAAREEEKIIHLLWDLEQAGDDQLEVSVHSVSTYLTNHKKRSDLEESGQEHEDDEEDDAETAREIIVPPGIANTDGIKALLRLALKCTVDVRIQLFRSLIDLFEVSCIHAQSRNLNMLGSHGVLELFIEMYGSYIRGEDPRVLPEKVSD